MTASAGEHSVCAVLAQLGWAASLTRAGLERTDILAVHTETRRMIEVQVKTIYAGMWPLGKKGIIPAASSREWYVFVMLGETASDRPTFSVVPRDHVAAATWIAHLSWRYDPAVEPGRRNAGIEQARIAAKTWANYEERWDLLHEDADRVPVFLPASMREAAEGAIGLPEGHPWRSEPPIWGAALGARKPGSSGE